MGDNANTTSADVPDAATNGNGAVGDGATEERPAFLVGEDNGESVQEAREADDEFPPSGLAANGKKYSSEDVAEKRKRLR